MNQNPYAAPSSGPNSVDASNKRLDMLARITIVVCGLWIGMLVLGRVFDQNPPPFFEILWFYALFACAPAMGIYGAWSTLKRQRYVMSLVGAGCMLIPLFSPWCGLTIPIGIWSLILLLSKNVRGTFSATVATPVDDNAEDAIAAAKKIENSGEWESAISLYSEVAARWPEHSNYVDNCIQAIRQKQAAGK